MKDVLLKTYKTFDKKPLHLVDPTHYNVEEKLPTQFGVIDFALLDPRQSLQATH